MMISRRGEEWKKGQSLAKKEGERGKQERKEDERKER